MSIIKAVTPNLSKFEAEHKAVESLSNLYAIAAECKKLHEAAGLSLPGTLLRIFSDQKIASSSRTPVIMIPGIERDQIPKEANDDWISIHVSAATPTTLAMALLRKASHPLRPKELVDLVEKVIPAVSSGTVYNLGFRLEKEGTLLKRDDGWTLAKPEIAPLLSDDLLWGPKEAFAKPDIAAHRREAIIHILRMDRSGLQIVQLVAKLHDCAWLKAPINKDLVKADMEVMEKEGMVRQRGNSRKWEVVPEE
jgi:hypothetical protein